MFRYKKTIPVSYDRQGYIYFMSRAYKGLPLAEKQRIRELCKQAGEGYSNALLEFVTTDRGLATVCRRHFLSESTMKRIVRKYYVLFDEQM